MRRGCVMYGGKKSEKGRMTGKQWQSVVSDAFFPLDTIFTSKQDFNGDLDSWNLGIEHMV